MGEFEDQLQNDQAHPNFPEGKDVDPIEWLLFGVPLDNEELEIIRGYGFMTFEELVKAYAEEKRDEEDPDMRKRYRRVYLELFAAEVERRGMEPWQLELEGYEPAPEIFDQALEKAGVRTQYPATKAFFAVFTLRGERMPAVTTSEDCGSAQ